MNDSKPATETQALWLSSDFVSVMKLVCPSMSHYKVFSEEDFKSIDVVQLLTDLRHDYLKARDLTIMVACQGGRTRSGSVVCYISAMLRLLSQIPLVFNAQDELSLVPHRMLEEQIKEWAPRQCDVGGKFPFHCPTSTRLAGHNQMVLRGSEVSSTATSNFQLDRNLRCVVWCLLIFNASC
jgi:hypothetical protein